MSAFIDFATYEAYSSTLNDLLSSGRLGIIRDDTLRAALAVWPAAVDDVMEDERFVVRMVEAELLPYLSPRIATTDLYNAGHAGFGTFPPSDHSQDFAALLEEREFESLLANRMAHERAAVNQIEHYAQLIVSRLNEEP